MHDEEEFFEDLHRRLRTPIEYDQLPNGLWRARRLGVVGIGKDQRWAAHDLHGKENFVDPDYPYGMSDESLDHLARVREGFPDLIRELLEGGLFS